MYVLVGVVVSPVGVKKQRNVTCTTKSITILLIFPIIGSTFHIHEWTLNRVDVLSCGRPANRDRVWDGREIDLYVHPLSPGVHLLTWCVVRQSATAGTDGGLDIWDSVESNRFFSPNPFFCIIQCVEAKEKTMDMVLTWEAVFVNSKHFEFWI